MLLASRILVLTPNNFIQLRESSHLTWSPFLFFKDMIYSTNPGILDWIIEVGVEIALAFIALFLLYFNVPGQQILKHLGVHFVNKPLEFIVTSFISLVFWVVVKKVLLFIYRNTLGRLFPSLRGSQSFTR